MATRKIKDAQDTTTNELIYFKGHAKATYMSDGRNVEEAIHQIGTGGSGTQGPQGPEGPKGDDGVGIASVVQTTTSSADGGSNVMTVTLSNGTKSTFTVMNGSKGSQGVQGPKGDKGDTGDTGATGANGTNGKDGADGATFTPSVDANGNLSWTNNKGLSNPPTVNIKGPKGDAGEGGGGDTEGISMKVETIIPYSDAIAFLGGDYRPAMKPNTIYVQAGDSATDSLLLLSIDAFEETSDAYAEYVIIFIFNSPRAADDTIILEVPSYIKWANGEVPTLEANVVYELNIARSVVAEQVSYNAVLIPFKSI